jgi:hypothetical protein
MIGTLVRAGYRSRCMILAAVTAMSLLSSYGRFSDTWDGSSEQWVSWALIGYLVIPTLAALLASSTFRGEHASWSWALARPVGRRTLFATLIGMDLITLLLCLGIARLAIGSMLPTPMFSGLVDDAGPLLLVGVVFGLYATVAAAAARGAAFLKAAAIGGIWFGTLVLLPAGMFRLSLDAMKSSMSMQWVQATLGQWIGGSPDSMVGLVILIGLLAGTSILAAFVGSLLPLLRAVRRLPMRLTRRDYFGPGSAVLLAGGLAFAGIVGTLWATAPDEVRPGPQSLSVHASGLTDEHWGRFVLRAADLDPAWKVRPGKQAARLPGGKDLPPSWSGLSAGTYDVCAIFRVKRHPNDPASKAYDPFEHCHRVEVEEGRDPQVVPLTFDRGAATPAKGWR